MELPVWARAHGAPLFPAAIRSLPEDFDVTEVLGFDFTGDGEHDYLYVEKRGANTEWVSRRLAAYAGVAAREVGYAGLKDRHATARQWFSVPRWNAPLWQDLDVEGVRLLDHERHNRKLRRGAHASNRFRVVLRAKTPDVTLLEQRLTTISALGVPNYFGEQRFGRGAANIALADQWSKGQRLPRHKRSIAISAARSYLFNLYLDARVRAGTWDRLIAGDVANLDGSRSVFDVQEPDEELVRRCVEMDIHPAGPLPGEDSPASVAPDDRSEWLRALTRARVKPASRSLRLRLVEPRWSIAPDSVTLEFSLGRGAFATAVLREIADVTDAAAERR